MDDDLESLVDCGTYCNEEALGSVGVASRLHKDIQHNAVLIDNTPKIVFDTLDLDDSRGATYFRPVADDVAGNRRNPNFLHQRSIVS